MAAVGSQLYVAREDVLIGACGQAAVQQQHGNDAQASALVVPVGLAVWLAVCWCKRFDGINTRIGWPWEYWHQGWWPILGWLAVCILVLIGFAAILASSEEKKVCQQPFFAGLAAWFLAALLLQTLPEVHGGVQFVPRFPWGYGGWFATTLSTMVWLLIALGVAPMCFPTPEAEVKPSVVLVVVAFGLNALLTFWSLPTSSPQDPPLVVGAKQEASKDYVALVQAYKDEISLLQQSKGAQTRAMERLAESKQLLLGRIKEIGITTKRELAAHKAGKDLAEELGELVGAIAKLKNEIEVVDLATERFQSRLRRIERQVMLRDLQFSAEDECKQLSQMDHELQEELRKLGREQIPGAEVHLDKALDEAFGSKDGQTR